jgi:hypothetical protein
MNWIRCGACLLSLSPCWLAGQTDALERFLHDQVVFGAWTPDEASCVMHHIELYGRPVVPQEAGAIRGLRPASIASLKEEVSWRLLCMGVLGQADSKSANRISSLYARVAFPKPVAEIENRWSQSVRIKRAGHWALRFDRGLESKGLEQIAGFASFRGVRKKIQFVVGDHVLRWGMGLNVWDQSPYDALNQSIGALPTAHWLTPTWGAVSSKHRSGLAMMTVANNWRVASSVSVAGHVHDEGPLEAVRWRNEGWLEAKSIQGFKRIRELRCSQLVRRQSDWGGVGIVGEGGSFLQKDSLKNWFGWLGLHAEGHWNNVRWAVETMHHSRGHAVHLTCLKSIGRDWDVYGSLKHREQAHPALRWNDSKPNQGIRFIWGGQKMGGVQSKWSGSWRAETMTSASDYAANSLRLEFKIQIKLDAESQVQYKFHRQALSDIHGWLPSRFRHSLKWQWTQEGLKMRIQANWASTKAPPVASGLGLTYWLEGRGGKLRWKIAASGWRVPEGLQVYGSEPTLYGVGARIMTGTGSRLSWWLSYKLSDWFTVQWAGHTALRSDRLSNSYLGFSTEGPVQTAMDFRLTVSM